MVWDFLFARWRIELAIARLLRVTKNRKIVKNGAFPVAFFRCFPLETGRFRHIWRSGYNLRCSRSSIICVAIRLQRRNLEQTPTVYYSTAETADVYTSVETEVSREWFSVPGDKEERSTLNSGPSGRPFKAQSVARSRFVLYSWHQVPRERVTLRRICTPLQIPVDFRLGRIGVSQLLTSYVWLFGGNSDPGKGRSNLGARICLSICSCLFGSLRRDAFAGSGGPFLFLAKMSSRVRPHFDSYPGHHGLSPKLFCVPTP